MKKILCTAAWTVFAAATLGAEVREVPDSLIVEQLMESVVRAVSVPAGAPFAVSNISSRELRDFAMGTRELPFLFARTPGVLAWGDNGLGTGTTYLRIRGSGDSRINVTLDGVPLNSPEDQCVFWANMNSYASFLGAAQIQRGVGSSSNGDGAFGGTVALSTKTASLLPEGEVTASYGSFNTFSTGLSFSSGLIGRRLIVSGGWHGSGTDGFMHGTPGRSGSWIGTLTFLAGGSFALRYHNIGNYEHTGQAWNGVDSGDLLDGNYGVHSGISGYADLYRAGLGRYNSLCESWYPTDEGYGFTPYPQITTDNFVQDRNILSASWDIDRSWNLNASLHHTYGEGYYSEFRSRNDPAKFGISRNILPQGPGLSKTDFVRKKGLTQHTLGLVANAVRKSERLELRLGASAQAFKGWHYGYLTYVGNAALSAVLLRDGDYKYYDSDAVKNDISGYAKASYRFTAGFSAFADLQYRFVTYRTDGINDKFYPTPDGGFVNQKLDIDEKYGFFNPKAGLEFASGIHRAFASVAVSHREPERNNFTDNGSAAAPVPERLTDYELGYSATGKALAASVTLYYMDYLNQFVQTGAISDIGEALTANIPRSYRTGIEVSAGLRAARWLDFNADAAFSRNRLLDFTEVVEDWDNGSASFHYGSVPIAFSPSVVAGGGFTLHTGGFRAEWRTSYVSRQYIDNSGSASRSLPAFSKSGLDLSYVFNPRRVRFLRDITLSLRLDNIFDSHHAESAWVYSALYPSGGHGNDNRYTQIGYFPSAGFTALGSIRIRF